MNLSNVYTANALMVDKTYTIAHHIPSKISNYQFVNKT